MFLAVIFGSHVNVKLKKQGSFYCLHCNAERDFEHRSWERTTHLFFFPVGGTSGEFILCRTCECAFAPECLDESTIADLRELLVEPPARAIYLNPELSSPHGAYSPGRRH